MKVKEVKSVIYADLLMETKVSEEPIQKNESDSSKMICYTFKPEHVNVNYTYAIEWEFE